MGEMRILVVDDQVLDAAVIKGALEVCFKIFGSAVKVDLARGPVEAQAAVATSPPDLLISDLFMPEQEFSDLSTLEQCQVMETPQGLTLLKELPKRPGMRRVATTFFWNYPGFDRYKTALFDELEVDGVIPKDIFYLCASLEGVVLKQVETYAPLRILVQALHSILWPSTQERGRIQPDQIRRFLLRSLFAEASSWLSSYPHHVLEVRNSIRVHGVGSGKVKYDAWNDASEIAQYSTAAPWMPCFVLQSRTAMDLSEPGFYKAQIKEFAEQDEWRIDVRVPTLFAIDPGFPGNHVTRFEWDGKSGRIESPRRVIGAIQVDRVLSPSRGDDRHWAQLLFTLGMFSYWCHLADHRAVRTAIQIAELIQDADEKGYRSISKVKKAAECIIEDLEMLELFLLKRIRHDKPRAWWRFIDRHNDGVELVGADKRRTNGGFGYWLNASFEITAGSD